MTKEQDNPFAIGLLAGEGRFADREAEVHRMAAALRSPGSRLIVHGDRRLGKSSALERAASVVRRDGIPVVIASLATASDAAEAAQRVLGGLQKEVGRNWRDLMEQVARALNITFEVDPSAMQTGGIPALRFSFGLTRSDMPTRLLPQVLDAINAQMEKRGEVLGIGLDEFQRIHEWGGEDAEWALRESLQRHGSIGYVLAGSRRSLIEAMVTDKGRAFWKIADVLPFGAIDAGVLAEWITEQAAGTGIRIPADTAQRIVRLSHPRTRDVVQLARAVWFHAALGDGAADPESVPRVFDGLLREQSELYRVLWAKLGAREQSVLRAFAANADVQITSAETNRRFHLGPKSSVHSAVERLVAEEHLTRTASGPYTFDDPFFRRWVQVYGLPDIGEAIPLLE